MCLRFEQLEKDASALQTARDPVEVLEVEACLDRSKPAMTGGPVGVSGRKLRPLYARSVDKSQRRVEVLRECIVGQLAPKSFDVRRCKAKSPGGVVALDSFGIGLLEP